MNKEIIKKSIKKYGTPSYVYDFKVINRQIQKIMPLIEAGCSVHYSMKANPALAIIDYIRAWGISCEVSSLGELKSALLVGYMPRDIIYVGPGKPEESLNYAINKSVRYIICESISELLTINKIAKKKNQCVDVLLRINPNFKVIGAGLQMGGNATQFGIDLNDLIRQKQVVLQLKHINVRGIQVYNATQVLNAEVIIENINKIYDLLFEVSALINQKFDVVDFGGGFGVDCYDSKDNLEIESVVKHIKKIYLKLKERNPKFEVIIELGRYLVAASGILIAKVLSSKQVHGKNFLITDAGLHCNYGISCAGSIIHKNIPIEKLDNKEKDRYIYKITGISCTPTDLLGVDVNLPKTHINDYLIFRNVGAYGLSLSPGRFISHGFPAEIVVNKRQLNLIRRRDSFENIIFDQFNLKGDKYESY